MPENQPRNNNAHARIHGTLPEAGLRCIGRALRCVALNLEIRFRAHGAAHVTHTNRSPKNPGRFSRRRRRAGP